MASFEGMITLLERIGFFSVIVPFILVYVIVFALLEKTKILGTVKVKISGNDEELARSNFNSMVAFCIAILFVVAQNLVFAMQEFINWVVILIILSMAVMLVFGFIGGDLGDFLQSENGKKFEKYFKPTLLIIIIVILLIALLNVFTGTNIIKIIISGITSGVNGSSSETFSSLVFFLIIIGIVAFITKQPRGLKNE